MALFLPNFGKIWILGKFHEILIWHKRWNCQFLVKNWNWRRREAACSQFQISHPKLTVLISYAICNHSFRKLSKNLNFWLKMVTNVAFLFATFKWNCAAIKLKKMNMVLLETMLLASFYQNAHTYKYHPHIQTPPS